MGKDPAELGLWEELVLITGSHNGLNWTEFLPLLQMEIEEDPTPETSYNLNTPNEADNVQHSNSMMKYKSLSEIFRDSFSYAHYSTLTVFT